MPDTWNREKNLNYLNYSGRLNTGRISVDLPDALEEQLRLKTIEQFGGKKGDLSRGVEEAVKTWLVKKE